MNEKLLTEDDPRQVMVRLAWSMRVRLRATMSRYELRDCVRDELVQSLYEQLLKLPENFQMPQSPVGYLLFAVKNLCINHIRDHHNREILCADVTEVAGPLVDDASPQRRLECDQSLDAVLRIVQGLHPNQRACLLLRRVYGYSEGELRARLKITHRAIQYHISAAYRKISLEHVEWLK